MKDKGKEGEEEVVWETIQGWKEGNQEAGH